MLKTTSLSRSSLFLFAAALFLVSCADEVKPSLRPLEGAQVNVNEILRIELSVNNPDGLSLEYSVAAPDLPSFADVTSLVGSPQGGEFRWTPLSSHVGMHELVFTIKSSAGSDSKSVLVEVIPANSAAPIFLRPGFGGTFDLAKNPCVTFDIEVRDDDSLDVDIRPREPLPTGAVMRKVNDNSKRSDFEWCPTVDQVERSVRWNIEFEADDGEHSPPTPHDYLVVLRTPTKTNCPGQPPALSVTSPSSGTTLSGVGGYPVEVSVSDDLGVRDAPVLHYTTNEPSSPADLNDFDQQRLFADQGGGTWRAIIPPLDLAEGQEQTITFIVDVTDNDDPAGTSCDHTTESTMVSFNARGAGANVKAQNCEFCSASAQCESGVCSANGGGRCLPACSGSCTLGTCQSTATIDGNTMDACGPAAVVCDGRPAGDCTNDSSEPNDSVAGAIALSSGVDATICPKDVDYWKITASVDSDMVLALNGFDTATADLDLALLAMDGNLIEVSGGEGASESIQHCMLSGTSAVAAVFAYSDTGYSAYSLSVTASPGACCTNDQWEPDNTPSQASQIPTSGDFDGTICPSDIDFVSFNVTGPKTLDAIIIFDETMADLDLELYGPDGAFIEGSWTESGQEEIIKDLSVAGTYLLKIVPYGEGTTAYIGQVSLTDISGCSSTASCPLFNVCSAGECVSDRCDGATPCPTAHVCATSGPGFSYGYCGASCTTNTTCRTGEACKWFAAGRGCGQTGTGQNGDPCTFFENCGSQRDCVAMPAGYCARVGCQSNADCESNTFCSEVGGQNICVRRCGGAEPACRLADGYTCKSLPVVGGSTDMGCTAP
ncbi:MAG: hypothetical protein AUK47_02140 [Deltaproteobacteria bacterium CG2_30_63_29]|nr:MAG: hypothetical protein AUK47_02140 [Deltaproteobacteria bacterium CG2_30_63_29]PJB47143.1 MAG: hypothetical protein CO108_04565 [Deltaproteobacteria bacterium CG_4_9_14_3_um_filter_63_12]